MSLWLDSFAGNIHSYKLNLKNLSSELKCKFLKEALKIIDFAHSKGIYTFKANKHCLILKYKCMKITRGGHKNNSITYFYNYFKAAKTHVYVSFWPVMYLSKSDYKKKFEVTVT